MGAAGGANIATNGAFLIRASGGLSTCSPCCPTCLDGVVPDRYVDITLDVDPFYHPTIYPQCPSQCVFGWDVDPSGTYRRFVPGNHGIWRLEPETVGASRQGICTSECTDVRTYYTAFGAYLCWGVGMISFDFHGPWGPGTYGWGTGTPPLREHEVRAVPIPYVSATACCRVSFAWI